MILTFVKKHRLIIFFSLIFIILRLPSLYEPYWYGDEGIYLTLGQGIRRGLILYRQIHDNKPPTLYYLAALSQTVFGFRLLLFIWMIPTVYLFYRLTLRFFQGFTVSILTLLFIILTSVPLIEGNIANAEIFMLLPTLAGIYLFLFSPSKSGYILSGLLLGIAFTIKVPVIFEFIFLCLWLIINQFDLRHPKTVVVSLLLFSSGFLLPIFLWGLYFYSQGAFPQFIFAAILQNFGYLSSWSTGTHSGSATSSGLMSRGVILLITYGLIYLGYHFKKLSSNFALILFWLSSTVFASLLSTRPYPHYLIQNLPPFCLLVGLIFTRRFLALPVFFIFLLIINKYQFYFYPVFSYYANSYSYLLQIKSLSEYRSYFGTNVNHNYLAAAYLTAHSLPSDRLLIWGDEPYLYPLASRLPLTRYTVAYHILDFNGYTEVIDAIKINPPKYIVTFPMANRPFPELDRLIRNYYFIDQRFGQISLYQLIAHDSL